MESSSKRDGGGRTAIGEGGTGGKGAMGGGEQGMRV